MKQIVVLLLVFSLFFTGCGFFGERIKEPVTFYYLCDKYQEDLCCVIVSEEREASGHLGDLSYLLALYRMGPAGKEMISPLLPGIGLSSSREGNHITLELTGLTSALSDIDLTLASTCLTLTCLEISDAEAVTILCGDRIKHMRSADLILHDTIAEITPMEES